MLKDIEKQEKTKGWFEHGKKEEENKQVRADPKSSSWLCSPDAFDVLCCQGYIRLADNPEIIAAVNKICNLVSSMTITPDGKHR